jgi:23S rRNA pseudouridine1911/1915/1917 synthase
MINKMMTEEMNKQEFEVEEAQSGERVDKFLSSIYTEQSRTFFQKLIKSGNVSINEKEITKPSISVEYGDVVTVLIPKAQSVEIQAENIPLDILYEDSDVLIVNKSKGMVVHPSAGHYSGTLVNAVMYHCADSLSGINGEIRPGIVHRIDMDTTGALIVCKNDTAHVDIAQQIKEHSVTRKYQGIVCGVVKDDEGTIEGAIGRHPTQRKKMAINEKNGKPAITHYRVLERFAKYTYMEFQLETGRTHQIRVHMASIGHPLLGDELYGNPKNLTMKGLTGQTLHAMIIGFIHPTTKEYIEVSAPLPDYFEELLRKFRL